MLNLFLLEPAWFFATTGGIFCYDQQSEGEVQHEMPSSTEIVVAGGRRHRSCDHLHQRCNHECRFLHAWSRRETQTARAATRGARR